jgi:hypothetical protein
MATKAEKQMYMFIGVVALILGFIAYQNGYFGPTAQVQQPTTPTTPYVAPSGGCNLPSAPRHA